VKHRTRRRLVLRLAATALLLRALPSAHAQADWRVMAVPFVGAAPFMEGVWAHHAQPRALALRAAALALRDALLARTDPRAPREPSHRAWRSVLEAWSATHAVPLGPLIERRTARRIDFQPTRPAQVLRAIDRVAAQPALRADEIGGPAKGLGALEWLLWHAQAPDTPAARRYAVFLADEIVAEAEALSAGFASRRQTDASDEALAAGFAEFVNQWVGALQALQTAVQRSATQPAEEGPRGLSGSTALELAARWAALEALMRVVPAAPRPVPGEALVPVEMLLRGRGLNVLADRLTASIDKAAAALQAAPSAASRREAAAALAALSGLAERDIAPALDVRIGFSDADGD
jgi:uncharacterized protein